MNTLGWMLVVVVDGGSYLDCGSFVGWLMTIVVALVIETESSAKVVRFGIVIVAVAAAAVVTHSRTHPHAHKHTHRCRIAPCKV